MADRAARLFTIPPGVSFVDALAAGLLAETAGAPLTLARYTILLPTRRARRALDEAFLRQADGRPLLLPRTLPLGDLDPDDALLAGGDESTGLESAPELADLPPAIPALRRQLLLAQAVQAAGRAAAAPMTIDQVGRVRRRREWEVAPFVYAGIQVLHPRLFAGAPDGPFSLNVLYDRAIEAGRLFGIRHDGEWFHVSTVKQLAEVEARIARGGGDQLY